MAVPELKRRNLIDISDEFETIKDSSVSAVKALFPIVGKSRSVHLDDAWVDDNQDSDDLKGQLQAKLEERTWAVPLMAKVHIKDSSGHVVDRQTVRLADIPKPTPRLGYIVGGQEYQIDRQWRLKPGIYSRVKDNGELESHINTAGGDRISLDFDPTRRKFNMVYGGSTIPLYPVLGALGAGNDELKKAWGPEILEANSHDNGERALKKLFKAATGKESTSHSEATKFAKEFLTGKVLSPEVTEATIGMASSRLDAPTLTAASKTLLSIARGDREPDDRDALPFKNLHTTEDFIHEKINVFSNAIKRRLANAADKGLPVDQVVYPGLLDKAVSSVFTDTTLSHVPTQDNPLEFLEGHTKTTILGQGGISNERMVTEEPRGVSPTQLGYMDPVDTPEGQRVGISGHLALGASKAGHEVFTPVYDVKSRKMHAIAPSEFVKSNVALPDSVDWSGPVGHQHPVFRGKSVRVVGPGNTIQDIPSGKVDYVMPSSVTMFSAATNLIPFLQNNSGARMGMADRHLNQAVPLKYREPALVQVQTKEGDPPVIDVLGALASHRTTVAGTVSKIGRGSIKIKDAAGKEHEVQIYDHFPLNDKKFGIHSEPIVAVGDHVRKDQVVADSSFSRNGQLALGTTMRIGYIALPSKTFEDSIVVSESGSKKLTSMHLHRHTFQPDESTRVGKSTYAAYYPTRFNRDQLGKLDNDGVVMEGQQVNMGDPLSVSLHKQVFTTEAQAMAKLKRSLVKPYADAAVEWDSSTPGKVVRVHKLGDGRAKVFVSTEEPAQIADKISGVYGNKGTIGEIRPDNEMPRDKGGKPIDVALNFHGIAGRINPGQVFELAAGKIAEKTGKPYLVQNFTPDVDYGEKIKNELKQHGISDTEELFDPKTGLALGQVLVGPVNIIKQRHQVERKISARSGGPGFAYDVDRQPRRGGHEGAQAIGGLGTLALLAHGSRNIIREAATLKSDLSQQDEMWRSIQLGQPLPPPKPTFVQKKFESYLNVLGVKLKKEGNQVHMVPMLDREVLHASSGEVEKPNLVLHGHNLEPETGGLFDLKVTGGLDGEKMSHIKLPESIPNPFFERGVQALTGLTQTDIMEVLGGKKWIKDGNVIGKKEAGAVTGGRAIGDMLKAVDVKKELKETRDQLPRLTGQQLDRANKRLRYLEALDHEGLRPDEAYMTSVVSVLPPTMRPITVLPTGDLATDPLNETYKALGITVRSFKAIDPGLPERSKGRLRKELYTSLAALQGVGAGYKRVQGGETQGIMDLFTQPTAKFAWVQSKLFKHRQDLSARSVIVPDPDLGLDEIGLPHRIASEIYKPFVIRELTRVGYSPLQAEQLIKKNDSTAEAALQRVSEQRPVLLKRDPVLHKYGIQAFRPKIHHGLAIKTPPLITGGFGADHDGDTMSVFVPITDAAVKESWKMMPSRNLLHPATGRPVYVPSNEMSLGLYRATTIAEKPTHEFKTPEEVLAAVAQGKVRWETVRIGGKPTTVGRVRIWASMPDDMRTDDMLFDQKQVWNAKVTNSFLKELAEKKPQEYANTVQKITDLGSRNVFEDAFSLSVNDFQADKKTRERVLGEARKEASKVLSDHSLTRRQKDEKVIDVWAEAGDRMEKEHWATNPTGGLAQMTLAGVKPNRDQYKQLMLAPMLMAGTKGKIIPSPVARSYSEGLDTAGFWVQSMAARRTMFQKTQEVREPGYLTKQVANTTADMVVVKDDCGTHDGISLSVDHPDVSGRYIAKPVSEGSFHLHYNDLITSQAVDHLRKAGVQSVIVRSALKCRLPQGICAKCAGTTPEGRAPEVGTNLGVIAGQAIGERSTQLLLRSFHQGGAIRKGGGQAAVSQFDRVDQLLRLPQQIPDSAVLAEEGGKVKHVHVDPAGGYRVVLDTGGGKELEHHAPGTSKLHSSVRVGAPMQAGSPLSSGQINMHDLLRTSGLEQVQNQIATELDDIYRPEGIRRRNIELITRGVTNLGTVEDAGDNHTLRRGDMVPLSVAWAWNDKKPEKPVKVRAVLKGVGFAPLDLTEDWFSKLHHERIKDTLVDAALEGHRSNVVGYNPFSALAGSPATFGIGDPHLPGSY